MFVIKYKQGGLPFQKYFKTVEIDPISLAAAD